MLLGFRAAASAWGIPQVLGGREGRRRKKGKKRRKQKMWGWGRWKRKGTFLIALF